MTKAEFDDLVDDAAHAVNDLIPDRYFDNISDAARSKLLFAINDALGPILRDLIDPD